MLGGEFVLSSDQVLIADDGSTIAGQTHVSCPRMTDVVRIMADADTSRLAIIAAIQSQSIRWRGRSSFVAPGGGVVSYCDLRGGVQQSLVKPSARRIKGQLHGV